MSTSRIVSLLVAVIDVYLMTHSRGAGAPGDVQSSVPPEVLVALPVVLALGLIWFAETLGAFRGYVGRGGFVDGDTPASLIAGFGWVLLFAPVAVLSYQRLTGG